jgi:type I restriction enzyme S subunit
MKPGYKQTEVGVIPEDWEVPTLGSLGSVIRGASPRPKGDKRFYGGDVPRLMVCSTGFCVLRCRAGVTNAGYVFQHLFASTVNRQIESLLTGSNYPSMNSRDVRALEIPYPAFPEQTAIAEVLSEMDAELASWEQRREKTRALKQGMMEELLTGRTRLVSPKESHA